ncbi:MAG: YabP/YqfC family sporulation protein [Candidatus Coprovivens sp.]
MDNKINMSKHEVKIIDRNVIYLTGVDKIVSFNNEEFILESLMGHIKLIGNSLEVIKLDTHDGIVSIRGNIDSLIYDDGVKKENESFLSKLFK